MKAMPPTRTTKTPTTSAAAAATDHGHPHCRHHRPAKDSGQDGGRVGADAEIGGVAEADHAGHTDQKIEAHGENGERGDLGQQLVAEGADQRPRGNRRDHQRQRQEACRARRRGHGVWRAGNKPWGRTRSTAAISAYIMTLAKDGR